MIGSRDRLIVVAPKFFNYEKSICNSFEGLGYSVTYVDSRPAESALTKIAIRLQIPGMKQVFQKYFRNKLAEILELNPIRVVLISPEIVPVWFIAELKSRLPSILISIYMWDSLQNKPLAKKLFPFCELKFSFDSEDCKQNDDLKYLPLFHQYRSAELEIMKKTEACYDISFFGTVHGDRTEVASKVLSEALKLNLRTYFFLYSQGTFMKNMREIQYFNLLKTTGFSISSQPLSQCEILRIIQQSRCVLDIEHLGQTGLTMRTFEVIFANRKLITTNKQIAAHNFFENESVSIIDRQRPLIDKKFSENTLTVGSQNKYRDQYSIENWSKKLIGSV